MGFAVLAGPQVDDDRIRVGWLRLPPSAAKWLPKKRADITIVSAPATDARVPASLGLTAPLTRKSRDAALHFCALVIPLKDDIVNQVVSAAGFVVSTPTHDKLLKYLELLASSGKSDEQLRRLGSAYLKETLDPDPRYSGC